MKKIGSYFLFIILLLNTVSVYAGDIAVEASVSSTEVAVGEQFTYSVTVSGSAGNLPRPELATLPSFKVYGAGTSSSFQFVNGAVSSSVTYNYAMIPEKAGTFTIPPAQLTYKGKVYKTAPINIVVTKSRPRTRRKTNKRKPSLQEQIFSGNNNPELFVRAIVNKRTAYVNEPILFSYKLYFNRISISQYGVNKPPDFSGFWVEDIPPKKIRKQRIEVYNGRKYYTLTLERRVLFPTTPGTKTIKPITFNFLTQDFFSFFGKRVSRKTEPVTIRVKPLPANKPKDFNGSVGKYSIKYSLSKGAIKQNNPFSLKIIIAGTGNIKSISEPSAPKFQDFKIYDTHSSINIDKTATGISGNKVFEYILIPLSTGKLKINSFTFTYFDIVSHRYKTIKTRDITLKVLPGPANSNFTPVQQGYTPAGQEVKLIGKDIRFIKDNINNIANQGIYFYKSSAFILFMILPFILLLAGFMYSKYLMKLETDIGFAKATRAYKVARKTILSIDKKLKKKDISNIDSLFEKLLINYISDKFNIPKSEIVLNNIKKILKNKNIDKKIITEIAELYEESNLLRYAPTKPTIEDYENLLQKAILIFNNIEQNVKKVGV